MSRLQRLRNKPMRDHRIYWQAGPMYVIPHEPIDQADDPTDGCRGILTGLVAGIALNIVIVALAIGLYLIVQSIGA